MMIMMIIDQNNDDDDHNDGNNDNDNYHNYHTKSLARKTSVARTIGTMIMTITMIIMRQ